MSPPPDGSTKTMNQENGISSKAKTSNYLNVDRPIEKSSSLNELEFRQSEIEKYIDEESEPRLHKLNNSLPYATHFWNREIDTPYPGILFLFHLFYND